MVIGDEAHASSVSLEKDWMDEGTLAGRMFTGEDRGTVVPMLVLVVQPE